MSTVQDPRQPAFDPFGEPLAASRSHGESQAAEAHDSETRGERRGFRETRRAAIVFWALALLLVGGRVYLTDHPGVQAFAGQATSPAAAQVAELR